MSAEPATPLGDFIGFLLKQWLVVASAAGLALTSVLAGRYPEYSSDEMEVLFILYMLFISVNGLHGSGLMTRLARHMEQGRAIPLKLVVSTFFLSMLVTNDVALVVIVPLTLSLRIRRKAVLVVLEALAANAGSALTPMGNPQNLFIYWTYQVPPGEFITTIAPFSLVFLALLVAASLLVSTGERPPARLREDVNGKSLVHGLLLLLVLLTVFHVVPVITALAVFLFALLFDRQSLRIDYSLLLVFLLFFGIADNLRRMLGAEITDSGHVFLLSALASQVMSNVPAALLFADFTSNWKELLWGTNAGGFGSLFGSLANLIAYRFYVSHEGAMHAGRFTLLFLAMGYAAFLISLALYFLLVHPALVP